MVFCGAMPPSLQPWYRKSFPPCAKELFQIRIGRRDDSIVQLVGERHIAIEVERVEIPVRVLEYKVLEMGSDNGWLGTTNEKAPASLATGLEPREDLLSGPRVPRPCIDFPGCFHLGRRQTIRAFRVFALQHLRIKVAAPRVF
jgi:hypothetical protein